MADALSKRRTLSLGLLYCIATTSCILFHIYFINTNRIIASNNTLAYVISYGLICLIPLVGLVHVSIGVWDKRTFWKIAKQSLIIGFAGPLLLHLSISMSDDAEAVWGYALLPCAYLVFCIVGYSALLMNRCIRSGASVANVWQQVEVPYICERMIGFSVPQDDMVLVVSYEGMHLVSLGTPIKVEIDSEHTEYDLYDPQTGLCHYRDKVWDIIGLNGGRSVCTSPYGELLVLDAKGLKVTVMKSGRAVWSSDFKNFSGDWAAATFSPDGQFIVLGCPYDFDFRIWKRSA